jgi:O-antigen/teichoic acid export membrane protein
MSTEIETRNPQTSSEVAAIARGAGIVMLGTIAGSGLKYLFEFVVARRLGPELFGVFFLALSIFRILEKVCTLELTSGMLRFVSLYQGEGDRERVKGTVLSGLRVGLVTAAAAAALLFVFSGTLAGPVFHAGALTSVLRLMSLGVVFAVGTEILVHSLQALGKVEYRVSVRLIFEPALGLVLALVLLRSELGLLSAALAFVAPAVLGTFLALHFARRVFPPLTRKSVPSVSDTGQLLRFSGPLFLAGLLSVFLIQVNPLMLGHFRPAAEVGVFGAALRTSFVLPLVLDAFNAIFAPMIADLTNRGDLDKLEGLFKVVTKWILTVSIPAFILLAFCGDPILRLWGASYREGLACLIMICVGQFINCATGPVGYMISMSGRTPISLANAGGALALNIVLNLLLIPRYGILGSAVALSASMAVVNLVRLAEVRWLLKMHPYRWDSFKPLAAGILALLVAALVKSILPLSGEAAWPAILSALAFSGAYAALLAALGIGSEDKLVFARVKEKIFRRRGRGPDRS